MLFKFQKEKLSNCDNKRPILSSYRSTITTVQCYDLNYIAKIYTYTGLLLIIINDMLPGDDDIIIILSVHNWTKITQLLSD